MLGNRSEIVSRVRWGASVPVAARSVSRRARGGAFSLIELVIAIAILVALTGLVLPAGLGWIARERFVEAGRQLPAALATARADARHDGVARRVVASVNKAGRVVIMAQRVDAAALEAAATSEPSAMGAEARTATVVNEQRPARVLMELPVGCSIVSSAGAAEAEDDPAAASADEKASSTAPARVTEGSVPGRAAEREESNLPVEPVTVVVYLADGGAVAPAKTLLTGPGGRLTPIWFDRWTGRAHVGERLISMPSTTESTDSVDQRAETEAGSTRTQGRSSEVEGEKGP